MLADHFRASEKIGRGEMQSKPVNIAQIAAMQTKMTAFRTYGRSGIADIAPMVMTGIFAHW